MAKALQQAQRLGMHFSFRLAAGAECLEAAVAQIIQDRFRHDGTRRISGAEEQNIVSHFAPARFVAAIAMLELLRSICRKFPSYDQHSHAIERGGERASQSSPHIPHVFDRAMTDKG